MDAAQLHAASSESQPRTVMQRRVLVVCILVPTACLIWLAAYRAFDAMSQQDAWYAYVHGHTRVLSAAIVALSCVAGALILWLRLLPGRPISAVIIGIIAATLILPRTSTRPGQRRELVSKDRFYWFSQTTTQYIAFAVPVIMGCAVASGRIQESISEQNAEPELPFTGP